MNFPALLNTIAALFLMMTVGFVAGKLNVITPAASKNLSRLIIVIGQPALIIHALVKIEFSSENLGTGFLTLAFGIVVHLTLALLSFFCFSRFRDLNERKISEFAAIFGNVGFVGFPILEATLGPKSVFMGAFFVVSFNLVLWTWGIAILARKRSDIRLTPKKILLNYGTVPSIIGLLFYLMKGLLPRLLPSAAVNALSSVGGPFLSALSYLASLCTPISMLIVGALLARRPLGQMVRSGKIYYQCAVKLLIFPVLICFVMRLIGFEGEWVRFAAIVVAMPSATSVTMLSELHDISPEYSAQVTGASAVLSLLTVPCVLWIAQRIIEF